MQMAVVMVLSGSEWLVDLVPDHACSGVLGAWIADALAIRARAGIWLIDVVTPKSLWSVDAS